MPVHDGFGDQPWFDAWFEAFEPCAVRIPLPVTSSDFRPELYAGSARILRRSWRFLKAPVNGHTPRYGWKLSARPGTDELDQSLREALRASGCDAMELGLASADGLTVEVLRQLGATGKWAFAQQASERNPLVDLEGRWEAYWQTRSPKLRKTLNAQERQLRQIGLVTYHDSASSGDWQHWLERGLELEARGWKGDAGSAILSRPSEAQFYRRVCAAAADNRRLRIFALTLDERVIAFHLMMAEDEGLFWLKVAYDEGLGRYGPAKLLLRWALRVCFEDPSVQVLIIPGGPDWTLGWSTRIEQLATVRIAPSRSLAGWCLRLETLARCLRNAVHRGERGR